MCLASALIFLLILAELCCIRTALAFSPDEITDASHTSKDLPIDIDALWHRLGINSKLFRFREHDSYILKKGDPYIVERSDRKPDQEGNSIAIIRITDKLEWDWQYLIFTKKDDEWEFLGHIDLPAQKHAPPHHRIMTAGEAYGMFLVIHELVGSGTGYLLYEDAWYVIGRGKLREVLRYPSQGHEAGNGAFHTHLASTVLRQGLVEETLVVEVEFSVSYTDGSDTLGWDIPALSELFSTRRTARYRWDSTMNRFGLDVSNSKLSEEEIKGFLHDRYEEFLKHNFEALMRFAASGNEGQKEWLRRFLQECQDSPQKEALSEKIH